MRFGEDRGRLVVNLCASNSLRIFVLLHSDSSVWQDFTLLPNTERSVLFMCCLDHLGPRLRRTEVCLDQTACMGPRGRLNRSTIRSSSRRPVGKASLCTRARVDIPPRRRARPLLPSTNETSPNTRPKPAPHALPPRLHQWAPSSLWWSTTTSAPTRTLSWTPLLPGTQRRAGT